MGCDTMTPDQLAKSGSEHGIQRAFVAYCNVAARHGFVSANLWADGFLKPPFPDVPKSPPVTPLLWLHAIPNGGARGDNAKSSAIRGAQLKAEGLTKGVLDMHLPYPRMPWHGLYIDFKKPKKGRAEPEQIDFAKYLLTMGYAYSFETSWRSAVALIKAYIEADDQPTFNHVHLE